MKVRPLSDSDVPLLREAYERAGYDYVFPDLAGPLIETVLVAVDDDGAVISAVAVERILQLYFFPVDPWRSPMEKLAAIRALEAAGIPILLEKGYSEVNAFVPSSLWPSFSRRLKKSLSWVENWRSLCRRF